jgi:hypothetical protein
MGDLNNLAYPRLGEQEDGLESRQAEGPIMLMHK